MYAGDVRKAKTRRMRLCIKFQIEIEGTVKDSSEIFNFGYQVTEKCKCEEENAGFGVGHFTSKHQWDKRKMCADVK